MQNAANSPSNADRGQIASTAYTLWEQAGRPAGRDMEFWLEAERRIQRIQDPRPKAKAEEKTPRSPVARAPMPAPPPASAPAPAHSGSWSPVVLRKRKGRTRAARSAAHAGGMSARQAAML